MRTLTCIALAVCCTVAVASAAPEVPGFLNTWEQARKVAAEQDKPIYLHFTTEWCYWCRQIESKTYPTPEAQAALKNFVAVSLDCTVPEGQQPAGEVAASIKLMEKLGGSGYPFLAMVTPDLAVLNTIDGYVTPDVFVKKLTEAVDLHKQLQAVEAEAAKADPKDYAFQLKALQTYSKAQLWDKAAAAGRRVRELDPENKKGDAAEAVFAELNAVQKVPAETDKARAERDKKIAELRAQAVKLDPANEHGVLQKVLVVQALSELDKITESTPPAEQTQRLQTAASLLTELTDKAKKLDDAQSIWILLGRVQGALEQWTKAREAFEKALAADPKSPLADRLKETVAELKKREQP